MSDYFLSIIIPYFNTSEYLPKLLLSIPDDPTIEVIVVDDSSTEDPFLLEQIKKQYASERIIFMPPNPNRKGAGCARNIGIKAARGRYIAFADSDDYFLPAFKDMVEKYRNSDLDMIFFGLTSWDLTENKPSNRELYAMKYINRYVQKNSEAAELCLRYKEYYLMGRFYKRSMFIENNIYCDATIKSNDVYCAMLAGYYAQTVLVDNVPVYCLTKHPGSITTSMNTLKEITTYKVYQRYYFFLEKKIGYRKMKMMGFKWRGHITVRHRAIKILFYELKHGFIKCRDDGAYV